MNREAAGATQKRKGRDEGDFVCGACPGQTWDRRDKGGDGEDDWINGRSSTDGHRSDFHYRDNWGMPHAPVQLAGTMTGRQPLMNSKTPLRRRPVLLMEPVVSPPSPRCTVSPSALPPFLPSGLTHTAFQHRHAQPGPCVMDIADLFQIY